MSTRDKWSGSGMYTWFRVQGSGFRVQGSGFRVQGLGFGFRGGLAFKAHRRVYLLTLGLRVIKKRRRFSI